MASGPLPPHRGGGFHRVPWDSRALLGCFAREEGVQLRIEVPLVCRLQAVRKKALQCYDQDLYPLLKSLHTASSYERISHTDPLAHSMCHHSATGAPRVGARPGCPTAACFSFVAPFSS